MDNQFCLNVSGIPNELNLIIELLKSSETGGTLTNKLEVCRGIDWDLFVNQAEHHRIYPILYSKLKTADEHIIPTYVIQSLRQAYKGNTFHMLHLSAEMERVAKLFTEAQIQLLCLKGPVLAHELYGDISLRTSGDLDVLIPIEKLEQADEILTSIGYEKDDYIQTVLNDWKWRHHHVTYIHPRKLIKIEIHWRLNPGPGKEPSFNELWERKSKSELIGYPVYLLGKEDLFLFLISHGARHGWSRLRWLFDIHQMMNQEVDWQKVYGLLNCYNYLPIGGQSIILASQLFHTEIAEEMNSLVASKRPRELAQEAMFYLENMINLHNEPVPENVAKYHSRHLFSLMSTPQKLAFIVSFLYPYPEDAETLPLPEKLHFLYFPLRPFLWAWRKTRKDELRKGRT
ncbi:nucleotidyltransferase family protein [Priestia aryabhattai]|uniref:nucleotidyltransferase domain-containing protein n=1 Tax=Priestia TaxID=2800373 RepID=UPI0014558C23|nr:nucleotidyltransferase family protein [Priestia aryabhattai]MBY0007030.1 nucleotidyltransferase family protein [Priestia aryabhattai]MBY0048534.1 nucleotidyltransferase family protein [Priestia aryabhattai]MED4393082.1 nucleotidyltransferase family protein [Priestia aryabhattai]NLR43303.1 nucleotidyltransferase family protein [Priestia megaterium]